MDIHAMFWFMCKVGVSYEAWKMFKRLVCKAWHAAKK